MREREDTQIQGRGGYAETYVPLHSAFRVPHWENVRRVLAVRLRSIGDTVLATPSLVALRRFLPDARIDILLEDWVAPVLEGFDAVDNVLTVKRGDAKDRLRMMASLRSRRYDVAYNLHGGATAGFFTLATRAKYRVGFKSYRNRFFYNALAPSSAEFWRQEKVHSAEQQLALLGWTGVPVSDKPKSRLVVTEKAKNSIEQKLNTVFGAQRSALALLHPISAFETKQWATENFARIAEFLFKKGVQVAAVAAPNESEVLENLKKKSRVPVQTFSDLSLPEITALAQRAKFFVGNDSGIAHIAAAVETPVVVIFGSSNITHWRPWTNAPNEIISENLPCAPCPGYFCTEYTEPQCIRRVSVKSVCEAINRILVKSV